MKETAGVLKFYRSIVNEDFIKAVQQSLGISERRGIFSAAAVIWLMLFQRLNEDHSLAYAMDELRSRRADELLDQRSNRVRAGKISGATGGYAQARGKMPLALVERAADAINSAIVETHQGKTYKGYKVYVVDGSTLHVLHTKKNLEAYPQYRNQYGAAHYPLVRIGVATDAVTGVALRPAYGAYNGEEASNELELAEELMPRIPGGSILIGDRYFGCCRFACTAKESGHEVVCRLKEKDAKRYIGNPATRSGEVSGEWRSTRSRNGSTYVQRGRFIWHSLHKKGFRPINLILFTTLLLPVEEIVELYGFRWNVELDLRDIKTTLGLDFVEAKSPTMIAKEIVLGVTAYNLIRHMMVASAKALRVTPRELSFSRVLKRVRSVALAIFEQGDCERTQSAFQYLLSDLKSFKLPKRRGARPSEPRKVWRKGRVTHMTLPREIERAKIKEDSKNSKKGRTVTH